MIASLQTQTYKDGRPLTDREIAHIMIALLMAGQHTSSATSTWTLLELASRPDVYQRLYDEQVQVLGDGQGGFRRLEYDDLKDVRSDALPSLPHPPALVSSPDPVVVVRRERKRSSD